ncbi:MAG: tRNA pseudouridine(55) synthase TruB [Acidobacteriales bacterium]|nr:tRNA pseudouridine(55) synthase TruB [Terriglobales bacterium]
MNGALILDKPSGITSHDVVQRVRRITGERSVGHLGTLDPMATGVLPLLLGRYTRLARFYGAAEKVYEGSIRFGFATDTYDAEGELVGAEAPVTFSLEQLEKAISRFRGEIDQVPPRFSAKKVSGVPAYKLARRDLPVELSPVRVTVHEFSLENFLEGIATVRMHVGAGTYARCLAHDLGQMLGTGAHLIALRRTRSGDFTIEQAVTLDALARMKEEETLSQALLGARQLLPGIPSVMAPEDQENRIRHGNAVNLPEFSQSKWVKVFAGGGELVAIASRVAGSLFQPKIVLSDQT